MKTRNDLWLLAVEGDRKPIPFLRTEFNESQAQISPDGRWIAYTSDESGRLEMYVRQFPSGEQKWKISNSAVQMPRWRRDGKELYYLTLTNKLMAAPVKAGPGATFEVGNAKQLFEAPFPTNLAGIVRSWYQPSQDGQRFLVQTTENAEQVLTIIINWPGGSDPKPVE